MISKVSDWLYKISTGWLLGLVILLVFAFTLFVLPDQAAKNKKYSRGGQTPDLSFIYSSNDLYHMAESYGKEGRQGYIKSRFSFDLIWPLAYLIFLLITLSWIFKKSRVSKSPWAMMNLLPFIGFFFDLAENSAASLVMARYPAKTPVIAELTPFLTFFKWIIISLCFLLIVAGFFAMGFNRDRGPKN